MIQSRKFKDAFKVSLAFALVYAIALKVNWMSPSWAGWSVIAIAASSSGQSIQKGFLRILGTILGAAIGVIIISVAAQQRWLFMGLTAIWLFIASYVMQSSKKRSYFWFVAGYVCLIITAAGPSSTGGFNIAVYRTMDTVLGIVVYTLITVFIWPYSNIGDIKKSANALLKTQVNLLNVVSSAFSGSVNKQVLRNLRVQEMKQIQKLHTALQEEGSESYEVQELRKHWDQFDFLCNKMVKNYDRLFTSVIDLSKADVKLIMPDFKAYLAEIESRLEEASKLLSGGGSTHVVQDIQAKINIDAIKNISHLDKAALAVFKTELEKVELDSRLIHSTVLDIYGYNLNDVKSKLPKVKKPVKGWYHYLIPEIEHLKGSFFVATTIVLGFVIWFYLNPPGHATFYIMAGTFALLFSNAQQVKPIKLMFPFLIAMVCTSLIYMFLLPTFTNIYQLCALLFVCMFIVKYYFSGGATLVFTIIILQTIVIDNPQTFDSSHLANSYFFVVLLMIFLYLLSYMINSPRPEKAILNLVSRFFKSAEHLVSIYNHKSNELTSWQKIKSAFYLKDLESIPSKIRKWGKVIDSKLFPKTDYKQIEDMANNLQILVVRLEVLLEANRNISKEIEVEELHVMYKNWKLELENIFTSWESLSHGDIRIRNVDDVHERMSDLELKLDRVVNKRRENFITSEGVDFYNLLGGYKGVAEATLAFVKFANGVNWREWQEEKFE